MPQNPYLPINRGAAVNKTSDTGANITSTGSIVGVNFIDTLIFNGTVGTGGTLTLNDGANPVITLPGTTAIGTVVAVRQSINSGTLTVQSFPTGGAVNVRFSYS